MKISRNSDEWLAKKKGVSEHACKIEYTVDHLRRRGSDFRTNRSQIPDWVRRGRVVSSAHAHRPQPVKLKRAL